MATTENIDGLAKQTAVLCEMLAALADPEHCSHEGMRDAPRDWLEIQIGSARRALLSAGYTRYGDRTSSGISTDAATHA